MKEYKIVVCDHIHQDGIDILEKTDCINVLDASSYSYEDKLKAIKNADGLITRSSTAVNKTLIENATSVKSIVRAGVGVDNVDIDLCSKNGIIVMNVPTSNTLAAVELTMTHMLSCARNFVNCNNELKSNIWNRENWYGIELSGKTLGVIGFGNIGSRVAIRAKSFDMNIIVYDPYIAPSKVLELDMQYAKNFEDILNCDFITLHTPKNSETINMINKTHFEKMNENTVLINCARGGLVNENDLYEALKNKKIKMAGIDVFDEEPAHKHKFLTLENTTITPHVGANTVESQRRVAISAAEQIINALRGISYKDALNLPIDKSKIPQEIEPYFAFAQKLGFIASNLISSRVKKITLTSFGDISAYSQSLLTFASVGVVSSISENVNYVNVNYVIEDKGIKTEHKAKEHEDTYLRKISIDLISGEQSVNIQGSLFNHTFERITSINGFELDVEPKGNMILFRNKDIPGVVSNVSSILFKNNINISDFRMGRNDKKEALAIIIVDQSIKEDILTQLSSLDACLDTFYVEL